MSDEERLKRIIINGLTPDTTYHMVENYFSRFGTLTECVVLFDRASKHCRGYGFVSFAEKRCVEECLLIQSHYINNVKVQLRLINDDEDNSVLAKVPIKKILISFLGKAISKRHIRDYFSNFGSVEVDCGRDGEEYEYFAYVLFEDEFVCRTCLAIGEHSIAGHLVDIRAVIRKEDLLKAEQAKRERIEREAREIAAKAELELRHSTRDHFEPSISTASSNQQQQVYDSAGAQQSWSQNYMGQMRQNNWPLASGNISLPITTASNYNPYLTPLLATNPTSMYPGDHSCGQQFPVIDAASTSSALHLPLTMNSNPTYAYTSQGQPVTSFLSSAIPSNSSTNITSVYPLTMEQLPDGEPPSKLRARDGTLASALAGYGSWNQPNHEGRQRYSSAYHPTDCTPLPNYDGAT